jgi:endonuclease-3
MIASLSVNSYTSTMHDSQIHQIMAILSEECQQWQSPSVTVVSEQYCSPFHVLLSCIISLRTKDAVTAAASARLFAQADTPQEMVRLNTDEIASLIYPAGFYRTKADQMYQISQLLLNDFGGVVPEDMEQLLRFKGVGRKTANLVITLGYGKPGICVDTHVHRITNRWGYVSSRNPDHTEQLLRVKLPTEYWCKINDLLVCYGQNRCYPVSPYCSCCLLLSICSRIGVLRSR